MKLRTRILVFAAITLCCLILGIYTFSSRLLMRSYIDLERQDAKSDLERAHKEFTHLASELHIKAVDWAQWDDSYRFMADHNQAFIKSNMVPSSIISMQLDLVMYLDLNGKVFYSTPVKRLKNIVAPSPDRVLAAIGSQRLLTEKRDESGGFYGAIDLPESPPMLISVRPVLTTKATGPARGWLVFGRYFGSDALKDIAERMQLDLQTWELDTGIIPAGARKVLQSLPTPTSTRICPIDEQSIAGYTQLSDIHNRPILLLQVLQPRSIYQQGLLSVQYLMRLILLASIAFSVVILVTLETFAFSRLSKLTDQVEHIDGQGSLARVSLPGRDELSILASTINKMLVSLEQSSQAVRESEEKLRIYNENLEQTVRERTAQIEHQAFHDALTDLPNRALFMNRLELAQTRAQRSKSPLAVIFVDLDSFKMVNDTLGHEAGDQLLKGIAERLRLCVRLGDTVARLGGDEFTILMEEVTCVEDALEVASSIIDLLAAPFPLAGREIFASASIGIAFQQESSEASDALLRNADTAMYEVKANGKSGYMLFDPSMNDHVTERLEIEMGLRTALERGELFLNYQPLICLESRRMVGVEALVRWQHPVHGLIPPGKFIPIAESAGLIVPIGYWVLEQACRQMKLWKDQFSDCGKFTMNINLSGKQLQRGDVVERVQETLLKTGVDPENIKLEITESVMMTDLEVTIGRLHALKALGVKLAMDDFGTGYSCMANMDSFPLDTVKIDRAFIQRLTSIKEDSGHMVEAIIALSKALHLDVTGEGVETLHQVKALRNMGCDIAQGYFFARPLTAGALEQVMLAGPASLANAQEEAITESFSSLAQEGISVLRTVGAKRPKYGSLIGPEGQDTKELPRAA